MPGAWNEEQERRDAHVDQKHGDHLVSREALDANGVGIVTWHWELGTTLFEPV